RLAVVASARRHDAGCALFVAQRRERVESAADLERPRSLQVLRLEDELPAEPAREALGGVDRRHARVRADPLARGLDVSDGRLRPNRQGGTPREGSHARPRAGRARAARPARAAPGARATRRRALRGAAVRAPRRRRRPPRRGCAAAVPRAARPIRGTSDARRSRPTAWRPLPRGAPRSAAPGAATGQPARAKAPALRTSAPPPPGGGRAC